MSNYKEILLETIEEEMKNVNNSDQYHLFNCFKILLKDKYHSKIFIYQSGLYLSNKDEPFNMCRFPDTIEKLYFNKIRDLKLKQLGI